MIVEMAVVMGLILFVFYLGYFLLMYNKAKGWKPLYVSGSFRPFVSIVVPTYNEEDTIVQKLKNLMTQDYPSDKTEIIVIDSDSEDMTVELLEKFIEVNKSLKLKLVRQDQRVGKASALNLAFKHCSGDIVAITDADAIWKKDALKRVVSNFVNPKVGAVTGRQVLINPNQNLATKTEKAYRGIYQVLRIGESVLDSTPIFHGEISCFRKSLIEEISEDSMADDSELAVKLRKKGYRSIYDQSAIFYEYAPPTFKSRFIQKLRRGQGLIQLFLREREMLFNRKYRKFGEIIFPAEFFMHIISPVLVFGFLILLFWSFFLIENYLMIILVIILLVSLSTLMSAMKKIDTISFVLSFLNSQFILLLSLMYQILGKSQHKWKKVGEIRALWKKSKLPNGVPLEILQNLNNERKAVRKMEISSVPKISST